MLHLIKDKFLLRIFIVTAFLAVLYIYNDRVTTNYRYSRDTQMRMAVIRTLGVPAVPIIAQCCTSRNLTEGIYARRSDMPGGFCFHADCEVVAVPTTICENHYTVKVINQCR